MCLYQNRWRITFSKIEFYTIRESQLLGRRLYLPSLIDVAWLEYTLLTFLIFNTFVCNFGWVLFAGKLSLTNVWKIRKLTEPTSFKLGEYNLLPSIVTLQFTNCVKFNSRKSCRSSDSHTLHCNFWPLSLSDKIASKTVVRSIKIVYSAIFTYVHSYI